MREYWNDPEDQLYPPDIEAASDEDDGENEDDEVDEYLDAEEEAGE